MSNPNDLADDFHEARSCLSWSPTGHAWTTTAGRAQRSLRESGDEHIEATTTSAATLDDRNWHEQQHALAFQRCHHESIQLELVETTCRRIRIALCGDDVAHSRLEAWVAIRGRVPLADGLGLIERLALDAAALDLRPPQSPQHHVSQRHVSPLAGPILLQQQAACVLLHELVGHRLELSSQRPKSRQLDQRIGPCDLAVVDDPTAQSRGGPHRSGLNRAGTYVVDDEATPATTATLVDQGCVIGFLADRSAARVHDVAATGHGRRASFRDPPITRIACLIASPGTSQERDLVADAVARVERVSHAQLSVDGSRARLFAPTVIAPDGTISGPAVIEIDADALVHARLGNVVWEEPCGLCSRDGQNLLVATASPSILLEARIGSAR